MEYKDDHVSHSVYVTFELDANATIGSSKLQDIVSNNPKVELLVWTTTPWTLTANMVRKHQNISTSMRFPQVSVGYCRSRRTHL